MTASPLPFDTLARDLRGELLTGLFDRGRYATDASIYQMMPLGVVVPQHAEDVEAALDFARRHGVPMLARGGGTSQCGQAVSRGLVIDYTKYLNDIVYLDMETLRCRVLPGVVLDQLNRMLKPRGVWFPVDVSTASRATIGGMAANNSCGSRSLRYGLMRDNVDAIDAILADGARRRFGSLPLAEAERDAFWKPLVALGRRERDEIRVRFPDMLRRVGGYNIDALVPGLHRPAAGAPGDTEEGTINSAHLLVGSEGTLALSEAIDLHLSPLPAHKLLGVLHFPSFHDAMDAAQHIVALEPVAVELIDRTMIELSMEIPMFRPVVKRFVRGEPEALLLVEFAEEDPAENRRRLTALGDLMGDLGFHWDHPPKKRGGMVEAVDPGFQAEIFEVRKAGLNIMMSMKEERKPVSFVEDCAVALEDLAEYTDRLTEIFRKHGTMGTWYAHASVGCLHVRPVLNLRLDQDVKAMRAIAEEAFDMVLEYRGSHSGEHGDGLVRSEFHRKMFGARMVDSFAEVKGLLDPGGILNPGKIVDPPKMDERSLFRYPPGYRVGPIRAALDWSAWPGEGSGFQGAVEMCNNNGACRKLAGGGMCPSYRVTRNERDLTRGRANSLRLAISGQLGEDALASDAMRDTMKLCVSCKACRRECPTGVDMARMKIEVAAARFRERGLDLHQKLVAGLPVYAPWFSRLAPFANLPSRVPALAALLEPVTGFSRHRPLPAWRRDRYIHRDTGPGDGPKVVLFADTFNTWFEPENLHAAARVLAAAGYRVLSPTAGSRPLCCGRTWLTCGDVDRARAEQRRLLDAWHDLAAEGVPIIGLEPSCTLGLMEELPGLHRDDRARTVAGQITLFESFLAGEDPAFDLQAPASCALLHGHCHQKAHQELGPVETVLGRIPGLDVRVVDSACCGMAGSFGYARDTWEVSVKMAEADLLPAVRDAEEDTLIVADGTSCRHQVGLGTGRGALHVARVIDMALGN